MTTRVINLRSEKFDVYIGRAGRGEDGYFGNPFGVRGNGGREEAVESFRRYFEERIRKDGEFRKRVLGLRGKRLGCFCKPLSCHGDVIASWVDAQPEERGKGGESHGSSH